MWAAFPKVYSRVNYSVMLKGLLRTHERIASADSSLPTAGRCFSTKSRISRPASRRNYCGYLRLVTSSVWDHPEHERSMYGFFLPPMQTCASKWVQDTFARTSSFD